MTSAAPGTGTATRARCATSSPTSTCRCSRRSASCRRRSTRRRRRSSPTAAAIGEHYDLYDNACFQTEVTGAAGTRPRAAGSSRTNRDDAIRARFVIMSNGPLHRPKLPGIPGIDSFDGHSFHTSRWDYDYTGGDPDGGPHRAGRQAGRHHRHRRDRGPVRSPPRCGGRAALRLPAHALLDRRARATHRPTPSGLRRSSPAGTATRMENFNTLVSGGFTDEDLVMDGWTEHHRQVHRASRRRPDSDFSAAESRSHDGARRLREDGRDPRTGRHRRRGRRHRRGPQALVPAVLQAPVLPRRVPRRLQPAERALSSTPTVGASSRSPSAG